MDDMTSDPKDLAWSMMMDDDVTMSARPRR